MTGYKGSRLMSAAPNVRGTAVDRLRGGSLNGGLCGNDCGPWPAEGNATKRFALTARRMRSPWRGPGATRLFFASAAARRGTISGAT